MVRKPDEGAIAAFVDELAQRFPRGQGGQGWPRYLFHITDAHNAASILRGGTLLSRRLATERGLMVVDNANANIIRYGDPAAHDYVRLYFRPRTPTFFCNEGIRPVNQRDDDAHCPIPVAFLFDAKQVLGMATSRFTDGGHNRRSQPPNIGSDAAFLWSLPWEMVYRGSLLDGRLNEAARDEIKHRQHAEVQIPHQLPLTALRQIFTRSPAERETLLTLIGSTPALPLQASQIRIPRGGIFFDRWSYVEQVSVVAGTVRITFNGDSETPGPFIFRIRYDDPAGTLPRRVREIPDFRATAPYEHSIPEEYAARVSRLTLTLDDSLAYQNDIIPIPAGSQLIS